MKNKEVWIGGLVCLLLVVSPVLLTVYYVPEYEEESGVYKILTEHGFDSWSEEDQQLLIDLMRATEKGENIEPYTHATNIEIYATYMDLLREAGYFK